MVVISAEPKPSIATSIPPVGKEIRNFRKEETRSDLIHRVHSEIKNLFLIEGKDVRPTVAEYEQYASFATDLYYANKQQARESDHNIEHASTVWALSLGIQAYLSSKPTGEKCEYDRDALAIGSFLHDSQRMDDIKESVFDLQGHGKRASDYIHKNKETITSLLDRSVSDESLEKAARICEFHDNEYRPPKEKSCDELIVVAGADRSTLPRILFSYHKIVASLGKLAGIYQGIVWRRAKNYEIKDHKDLMETFLPIGTLLCLLAREKVGENFNFQHQFIAVEHAAIELGLLREE